MASLVPGKHNYYEILQITRDADQIAIKKAFHRLAKIHHPDKCTVNNDIFLQLNEAYNILSDPEKKSAYDYALDDCVNEVDVDIDFISKVNDEHLRNMLDEYFFNIKSNYSQQSDTVVKLKVKLEDIYTRKRKRITVKKLGDVSFKVRVEEQIAVFPGAGVNNSDLVVEIVPLPHPMFGIKGCDGNDLIYFEYPINLEDTFVDYYYKLTHLDGSFLYLRCAARSVYGSSLHKISGYGLPVDKTSRGELYIQYKIIYPAEFNSGSPSTEGDVGKKRVLSEFEKKLAITTIPV